METKIGVNAIFAKREYNHVALRVSDYYSNFIKQVLDEVGSIDFDHDDEEEYVTMCYDGGNHPEYKSNMSSTLYSVRKETYVLDGRFMNDKTNAGEVRSSYIVTLEDGEMLIGDLLIDDVIALAEAIEYHINKEHEDYE